MKAPFTRRRFVGLLAATAAPLLPWDRVRGAVDVSMIKSRADEASRLIESQIRSGEVAAAAFLMRQGGFEFVRGYGQARSDTPFLVASPTKPMTVSVVMWLRERGELSLSDPVEKYLPQFRGDGRDAVTIKHLLNHTSGLPDMLPENVELRRRHAPLSEFIAGSCRTPLLFAPGAKVSYQSMGILLAAAIAERITGQSMAAFLTSTIFGPLRMTQTSLDFGGRNLADTAQCQVAASERSDWDWNSPYWRNLGAPWGGAHSTVRDLAAFTEAFVSPDSAPWAEVTRREMLEVQTGAHRPRYGLGWVREPGAFGKTCSAAAFGHFGATGTVVWHDPESHVTCVVLTTRAAVSSKASLLVPVSEIVGRSDRGRA
mgnify:CR=1 FL=1